MWTADLLRFVQAREVLLGRTHHAAFTSECPWCCASSALPLFRCGCSAVMSSSKLMKSDSDVRLAAAALSWCKCEWVWRKLGWCELDEAASVAVRRSPPLLPPPARPPAPAPAPAPPPPVVAPPRPKAAKSRALHANASAPSQPADASAHWWCDRAQGRRPESGHEWSCDRAQAHVRGYHPHIPSSGGATRPWRPSVASRSSHHVASHRIASHRIASHRIASHHNTSPTSSNIPM